MGKSGKQGTLVLTREVGQRIMIEPDIVVELNKIESGQRVRLAITAPGRKILREEIVERGISKEE